METYLCLLPVVLRSVDVCCPALYLVPNLLPHQDALRLLYLMGLLPQTGNHLDSSWFPRRLQSHRVTHVLDKLPLLSRFERELSLVWFFVTIKFISKLLHGINNLFMELEKFFLWDIIIFCFTIRPSFTELVTFMSIFLFNFWSILLLLFYLLNHLPRLHVQVLNSLVLFLLRAFVFLGRIYTQKSSLKFFVSILILRCLSPTFLHVFQLVYPLTPFLLS